MEALGQFSSNVHCTLSPLVTARMEKRPSIPSWQGTSHVPAAVQQIYKTYYGPFTSDFHSQLCSRGWRRQPVLHLQHYSALVFRPALQPGLFQQVAVQHFKR
jgi:hypothetical protein